MIGRTSGLTDDDLAALDAGTVDARDPVRAVLLRAADELVAAHRLSDPVWNDLTTRYPTV